MENITSNTTNVTDIINATKGSVLLAGPGFYAPEPEASHVFRLVLFAVIFLTTILGNIFVVVFVFKTRELHSVTGYLISNLSLADLGVGLLCLPFSLAVMELKYWPFGLAMCKIIPSVQAMSVMASVATLSAISFDRFRSIAYPYEARISVSKVKFIVTGVWILSAIVGLPLLGVMDIKQYPVGPICDEFSWTNQIYKKVYTTATFLLTYAIPLPLIAVMYAIVVYKLEQAAHKGDDSEGFKVAQAKGKVVRMLIVVVAAYFLCFLPYQVTMLWWEFGDGLNYRYFWVVLSYSQVFVYANSCINPILYCIFSEQFRRGFLKLCRCGARSAQSFRRWSVSKNSRSKFSTIDRANKTVVSTFESTGF